MKFTNKYGLPKTVFDVLANDGYKAGKDDYSVTSLLKSPRQLQLYRRNFDNIEEDVSDRVWSLLGQAAHSILEKHGDDTSLVEERLYTKVYDRTISGQVDHFHNGTITDYKVTSVWTLIRGTKIEDWTKQLNIYAYIFNKNDYEVRHLQIVAILRDWSETEKLRNKDYPASPIVVVPITLWDVNEQEVFVHKLVGKHIVAEKLSSSDLPKCTPEEMWQTPNVYAVMKEGRKSAIKLFDNKEAANEFILESCPDNWKDGHSRDLYWVQTRPGTCRNCERYCPVSSFCSQWEEIKSSGD